MITVKVDAKGRNTMIALAKHDKRIADALRRSFYEVGRQNQRFLRNQITKRDKSGRLYRYAGRLHRASAPHQFPANRSGKLRGSVDYIVSGDEMEFGVGVEYGKFLEEGTRKMKPRKLVMETARQNQRNAVDAMMRYTNEAINAPK